jgi:hypothetical protein
MNEKKIQFEIDPHVHVAIAPLISQNRGGTFKLLWSQEIDSKESIPPAYVAWRVRNTRTLFLLGSWSP